MVREFESLNQLFEVLRNEAHDVSRFPTRFVLVYGLNAWKEVLGTLNLEVDEIISLSSLCRHMDLFPTISVSDITSRVEKAGTKKAVLSSLTECLRFSHADLHSHYSSVLRELAQWEYFGKKRLYIPILEYTDSFNKEMDKVPRWRAGELPEVWAFRAEGNIVVHTTPFGTAKPQFVKVDGFKAFLDVWEKGGVPRIQLVTQIAPFVQKHSGNYEIRVVKGGFDIIKERTTTGSSFRKEWGLEEQWRWLAEQLEPGEDFRGIASRLLNVRAFDELQLLSLWDTFSDRERWLVWIWGRLDSRMGTYFQRSIEKTANYKQVIDGILGGVFDLSLDLEDLKERKALLESIRVTSLPASFWQALSKLQNPAERLKCLTGITEREKQEAILCLRELLEDGSDPVGWWPYLEIAYAELTFYLRGYSWKDELLEKYLRLYLESRVLDTPQENLLALAREIAQSEIIWGIPTRQSVLEKKTKPHATVLWIDGMGLEWIGLLKGLIGSYESVQIEIDVARANLPTTTGFNKGWEKEDEVLRGLDQMAHRYDYSYPRSFVEQIEFIKKVVQKATDLLREQDEVIITSDHGLSRSSFHKGQVTTIPEDAKVHQWGRFAEFEAGSSPSDQVSSAWLADGNKIYLAVHGRFEGGSGSIGEIHGGATPEEWLVPVIRLVKSAVGDVPLKERLSFKLIETVVRLDVKGKGLLRIQLSGSAQWLNFVAGARTFSGVLAEPEHWEITLDGLRTGSYRGRLEYEDGLLGEITFEVIKGIKEDDMGL